MKITTKYIKILADLHTPVELYLKLRDRFTTSFLLESTTYDQAKNSYSYLCLAPIKSIQIHSDQTEITQGNTITKFPTTNMTTHIDDFLKSFDVPRPKGAEFIQNGVFGYTSYDSVTKLYNIKSEKSTLPLPLAQYHFFRYLIIFDHFHNQLYLVEHLQQDEQDSLDKILSYINDQKAPSYTFETISDATTCLTDQQFHTKITKAKKLCQNNELQQIVLSRAYQQNFIGDEFNVYRALRSINPSPYLFYFDYNNFKIFGSSPESQCIVHNNKISIHPIAGTYKKTHNREKDDALALELIKDPKEKHEHMLLVELAKKELESIGHNVQIEELMKIEHYSAVMHLVSKLSADLFPENSPYTAFTKTFPAGTLSGAPKIESLAFIEKHEPVSRGLYAGAIGILTFDGELNKAIIIRSVFSHKNTLTYQAGCGIVDKSVETKEIQEIHNKLHAIKQALIQAKTI